MAKYRFGAFELDRAERTLRRDGHPIALTPKALDLLIDLVEHHGHLVEKSTLISTLWPDTIVEEANLAFQISTVRKAVGQSGDGEDAGLVTHVAEIAFLRAGNGYSSQIRLMSARGGFRTGIERD